MAALGFDAVAMAKYPQMETLNHVHTGGNSSGIVDGSGAVLVGSKEFGEKAGLKPRAKIRGFASIGSEPTIMLTAPAAVTEKALKNVGMRSEEHTSELQSLMRISYAVFCLKKKKTIPHSV